MTTKKKHSGRFLKTYFKEKKQVGAVAPSSRFLVKRMCDKINFDQAKVIIELGPGTGVFTRELLKRSGPDTKIILFELNDTFIDLLRENFNDERLIVLHQSADELDQVLEEHGIQEVDAVLSSLPLAVIPNVVCNAILDKSYDALKKGGVYVQYQYSLNSKKLIKRLFPNLKLGFVPANIPPAFVYTGTKP